MSYIYRIVILLLIFGFTACTSTQQNLSVANGEDRDIGLGGTGLLASAGNDEDGDVGLGGTGILGAITGFGSIFVNGIEIEYDNNTAFTVDGKPAEHRKLEVGDVVEVLTKDSKKYTQAQVINLRHEIIGKVESVDLQTFSFTIQGQTIVQSIDKIQLPVVGATVAVSGFRIDKRTVVSTRVVPADDKTSLLRTHTALPFKEKAADWLVQVHVQDDKAEFELGGNRQAVNVKKNSGKSYADRLGVKILKLHKSTTGQQLMLEQVIEPTEMPRGQSSPIPAQQRIGNKLRRTVPGAMPGSGQGSGSGSGLLSGPGPGSGNTNPGPQSEGGKGR